MIFDGLSCTQNFLRVGSVLPVRLKWGCGHSSSNVEKTLLDVAIHVPGKKKPAFGVTCAKLIVTRSNALTRPCMRKKTVRARQAVDNREEEGCVYSIPLSDLIGKLLELKNIRTTRAHPYHPLSLLRSNEDLFLQNCSS